MAQDIEAKNNIEFDQKADALLDKEFGKETAGVTSTPKETEGLEPKPEEPKTDLEKTEEIKKVEEDKSLSVEEKLAKIEEILGDDEKAIDAYIKQKGYHTDPAWKRQRGLIDRLKQEKAQGALTEEDKAMLEDVRKVASSREYIETSMKAKGYTPEAIDSELKKRGFDIPSKPDDDVELVLGKLGVKPEDIDDNTKAIVKDVSSIVDILLQDRLGKILPKALEPIQKDITTRTQTESAGKVIGEMKEIITKEDILDFEKDIEPELDKFMDENPEALQEDVFEHFRELNHRLSLERLRSGKKKIERDEDKTNLRQIPASGKPGQLPAKTGEFDKDADALLDSMNVH